MTIQLDVKALTALIEMCGGEPFVLELRKAVLQTALEKYTKALVNKEQIKASQVLIDEIVKREIGELKS